MNAAQILRALHQQDLDLASLVRVVNARPELPGDAEVSEEDATAVIAGQKRHPRIERLVAMAIDHEPSSLWPHWYSQPNTATSRYLPPAQVAP